MSKMNLEDILNDYTTQDIIDAVGVDNLLDCIGINEIVDYFGTNEILDKLWDSDIEDYYNTYFKEENKEKENDPLYHLIKFCRCVKNDYNGQGFHSYQIREMFNDYMDFIPEKFYDIY